MTITDALATHRDDLVVALMGVIQRDGPANEGEIRQYVVAFHALMTAAAAGDNGPRDEYLASIAPPLRENGVPIAEMFAGLVGMAAASGAILGAAHVGWLSSFFSEYARELCKWWEQA